MTPSNPKKKSTDLAPLVVEVLKSKGLTLPETEDEIAAAEAELAAEEQALPLVLCGPWGFLDPKARLKLDAPKVAPVMNEQVERELARAARAGSKLTKEVEERMCKDREAAEARGKDDEEE